MKRLTILILTIVNALLLQGQQKPFVKTNGVKMVLVKQDCMGCKPSILNKTVAKYLFDKDGNNIIWYSMEGGKPTGKMTYNFQNGILTSYQNNSNWVSTSTEGDFGMVWDSTILSNEESYRYANRQLINTHGIDGDTKKVSFDIYYTYNADGKVLTEETKTYPNTDIIGNFESGTDKLTDAPDALKLTTFKRTYQYTNSSTQTKYFKDGVQTGFGTIELDDKGYKVREILKDMKGNILTQFSYKYNDKEQLIEKTISDKGFNGFGYQSSDTLVFEKEIMSYDSKGNLTSKKQYYHGLIYIEEHYQYIY